MTSWRIVRMFAGLFILLSLALGVPGSPLFVNPWWLALAAFVGLLMRNAPVTFIGSSASAAGIIASVGASMYPFILPSSLDPGSSLTAWSASSSHLTLFIMLIVTAIFLPIVLVYTSWAFKVMWGRVSADEIERNQHTAY